MPNILSSEWLTAWLPALPHALQGRVDWYLVVGEFQQAVMIDTMGQWLLIIVMLPFTEITYITYGLLGTGVGYLWIAGLCCPTCRVSHHHENQCKAVCVPCNLLSQQLCGNLKQKTVPTHYKKYESPAPPPSSEEAVPGLYTLYTVVTDVTAWALYIIYRGYCCNSLGSIHYIQWLLM